MGSGALGQKVAMGDCRPSASSGDTRYKSRADAEGHQLLLKQRVPDIEFKVVFDLPARKE